MLLIAEIVVLFTPVFILLGIWLNTYFKSRGTRLITCPEIEKPAVVEVDAKYTLLISPISSKRLHLKNCSRWPERKDCGRACEKQFPITYEAGRQRLTGIFRDRELEREFLHEYYEQSVRRTATITYAVGAVMLSGYVAVDYTVLPEAHPWPLVLRFALLVPVCFLLLLAVRTPWYERWHGPLMLGGLWTLTAVVASIGLAAPSPARELYVSTASAFGLACSACRVSVRATIAYHAGVLVMLATAAAASELAWTTDVFLALNICGIGCFAVMGSRIVDSGARTNFLQRRTIEAERRRSDHLLLNILPRSVADRLKQGQGEIADAHGDVSVLFVDLVGFTSLSTRLAPSELVRRLNMLFTEFDRLTERYGVEKIKTIGDAYMVAAGVPEPMENGAEALTDLALDMLDACKCLGGGLEIRAGIHSGPAVAGVIGTRKFSYDLWGDTVNTAARMESHGMPGKIQISDDTRRRLGPRFLIERRGDIEVKGRGRMVTWFIIGRKKGPIASTWPQRA